MKTGRVYHGGGALRSKPILRMLATAALAAALVPSGLFATPPLFIPSPGSPIKLGNYPQAVATGDFNGDGNQDIAVAYSQISRIDIYLGDGAGNFTKTAASPFFPGGGNPYALIALDFNKDNKIDLAVQYLASSSVEILLGDGTGNFTQAPAGPAVVASAGGYMAAGDFNGDHVPDLVVTNNGTNSATVLLSDGLGGFLASPVTYPTGKLPTGVTTGDFNRDGSLDFAAVNSYDGTTTIYLGNGTGGFNLGSTVNSVLSGTFNSSQTAIATGDFFSHGAPIDLITLSSGINQVNLLKGDGTGSVYFWNEISDYQYPNGVVVADFDGDGNQDVAVIAGGTSYLDVYPGDGKGGLNYKTGPFFQTGKGPVGIAMADFDGDGRMDIVTANITDGTLSVFLTNGPKQAPPVVPPVTPPSTSAPVAATQTISFNVSDHLGSDAPFAVQATASSGLPVSFVIGGGPATISGNIVTLTGLGTVAITALQPGNSYYAAASVTQSFNVSIGTPTIKSVVNGASFKPGLIPPNSYATLFGTNLTSGSKEDASVPQSLDGTTLTIVDSAKHSFTAGLFFASFWQLNFVVPAGVAAGPATFTVTNSQNKSASATVTIGPVMPGLFSGDGSGAGEVAGEALIINRDGTQTTMSTSFCTPFGCSLPVIPMAAGTNLYLLLYGTGIQGRDSLANVSMTIGGTPVTVLYAGPQGSYPALDQVDVLVPASLAGAGVVNVVLTVDGTTANSLQIKLQ